MEEGKPVGLKRKLPPSRFRGLPCCVTSIGCATGKILWGVQCREDGYLTLREMNKLVREHCPVKRRVDFKRGQRPKLKDLHLAGKAVVCVLGHYLYIEGETCWSFFRNADDEVVTVWELKGE